MLAPGVAYTPLPGVPPSYLVSTPVREGKALVLNVSGGVAGDLGFLLLQPSAGPQYVPPWQGSLLPSLGPPIFLKAADLDGDVFVSLHAPLLPPGAESLAAFTQVALAGPGSVRVTNGATFLLLDAAL